MDIEVYKQERRKIIDSKDKELDDLAIKYALSNNSYKIGDIIEDLHHKIKIHTIDVFKNESIPSCIYIGYILREDNTFRLDKRNQYENHKIHQNILTYLNIKEY